MRSTDRELIREEKRRLGKKSRATSRLSGFTIWARILFALTPITLISLVLASYFTPLLAIEKVVVSGTERIQSEAVVKALDSLSGRPLTTVSSAEVASLLGDFPLIETFTLQAEPPNTLRLKIRERAPLMIMVRSGQNYLFDAAGVQISPTDELGDFPFFEFNGDPAEDPRFKVGVELLLSLPKKTYDQVFSISVSSALTSKLTLRQQSLEVIWGSNEDALLKAEVLDSLIATGLDDDVTVDVSSPTSPVVRYPD